MRAVSGPCFAATLLRPHPLTGLLSLCLVHGKAVAWTHLARLCLPSGITLYPALCVMSILISFRAAQCTPPDESRTYTLSLHHLWCCSLTDHGAAQQQESARAELAESGEQLMAARVDRDRHALRLQQLATNHNQQAFPLHAPPAGAAGASGAPGAAKEVSKQLAYAGLPAVNTSHKKMLSMFLGLLAPSRAFLQPNSCLCCQHLRHYPPSPV